MQKIKLIARIIVTSFTLIIILSQVLFASSSFKQVISRDVDYIVCIDGGGSKTSLQILNPKMEEVELEWDGNVAQLRLEGSSNINTIGLDQTKQTLENLLKGLKIGPERQEFKAVQKKTLICGLAGLSSDADKVPLLREMFVTFGFQPTYIFIASDIEVAKQLLSDHGAVLIAGTGSICFSKVSGKEKCIGGYGPLLGDEGSGWYVGKLALQAAFQTVEEDKPFILMQALTTHFNVPCITDVIEGVYDHKIQTSEVAKIAPLVFDAAFEGAGDERCKDIVSQCASELAKLITRAVDSSSQADFPIYLMGGIFKDKNHDQFINMIRQKVIYNPVLKFVNISQKNIVSEIVKRTQQENQDMN